MIKRLSAFLTRSDRANIAVTVALSMPVVIGAVAMGAEVGYWRLEEQRLQKAADASAMSAMADLPDLIAARSTVLSSLGRMQEGGTTTLQSLNSPPTTGPFVGDANAVEVVLQKTVTPLFSSLFLEQDEITLTARSVATTRNSGGGNGKACILALDETMSRAIDINGTALIDMPDCLIVSNSSASDSFRLNGTANVTAYSLSVVGDYSMNGSYTLNLTQPKQSFGPAVADPYAGTPTPSGSGGSRLRHNGNSDATFSPGTYSEIKVNSNGTVTFEPGVYVVDGGGVSFNGSGTIQGSGITIYMKNGADMTINGSQTLSLSAPTSGTTAGILFWSDEATGGDGRFNGSASADMIGAFYFPGASITINGSHEAVTCSQLIANDIRINGTSDLVMGTDCDGTGVVEATIGETIVVLGE